MALFLALMVWQNLIEKKTLTRPLVTNEPPSLASVHTLVSSQYYTALGLFLVKSGVSKVIFLSFVKGILF